jgi:hypothetical protein
MPIKACADRLKAEIEQYGCPPIVPDEEPEVSEATPAEGAAGGEGAKKKASKGKVAAKKGKGSTQYEVLKNSGIPEEEIPSFQCAPFFVALWLVKRPHMLQLMHVLQSMLQSMHMLHFMPPQHAAVGSPDSSASEHLEMQQDACIP